MPAGATWFTTVYEMWVKENPKVKSARTTGSILHLGDTFTRQGNARLPAEDFQQHGYPFAPFEFLFEDCFKTREGSFVDAHNVTGFRVHRVELRDSTRATFPQPLNDVIVYLRDAASEREKIFDAWRVARGFA